MRIPVPFPTGCGTSIPSRPTSLEVLRIPPGRAIVVENAPLGVRAAKAAGLRVIGVASTNPPEVLREADVVVARVADVGGAIASLDRKRAGAR